MENGPRMAKRFYEELTDIQVNPLNVKSLYELMQDSRCRGSTSHLAHC